MLEHEGAPVDRIERAAYVARMATSLTQVNPMSDDAPRADVK
jgi:hypothetical protein